MIPIYKPYMPNNLEPELSEILYSGNLSFGKYGRLFEEELKTFISNQYILTTSSYNIAMLIVLSTLGLKEGDEVLASPVSCLASNQSFAVKNIKVIWCDVDPSTGMLDIEDVESKISKRTKAIFHNHFCGYVGDTDAINAIGNKYGIPIVDDAIEAFGSKVGEKYIGNIGTDISVFSFQTVRLPNTIDGGAISFKNKELFERAKFIRDYGIDRSKFRDNLNEISTACDITLEGYAGLMSEINSYIGFRQMSEISSLLAQQQINAHKWDEIIFEKFGAQSLKYIDNTTPNYWIYGTMQNKLSKEAQINKFRSKGYYATGVHINNNVYSVFGTPSVELKGVNEFMRSFVAIPSGWWIK